MTFCLGIAATVAIWVKEPLPVFLSILYPSSPVAFPDHVSETPSEDTAVAVRVVGVCRDDTALYALILALV